MRVHWFADKKSNGKNASVSGHTWNRFGGSGLATATQFVVNDVENVLTGIGCWGFGRSFHFGFVDRGLGLTLFVQIDDALGIILTSTGGFSVHAPVEGLAWGVNHHRNWLDKSLALWTQTCEVKKVQVNSLKLRFHFGLKSKNVFWFCNKKWEYELRISSVSPELPELKT